MASSPRTKPSPAAKPLVLPDKVSSRRFSKVLLVINGALAWVAVFYGISHEQSEAVVSALGLVGLLYGAYTGIGHLDFRRVLVAIAGRGQGGGDGLDALPTTTTTTTTEPPKDFAG
jgi:hypothetical protein